MHAPKVDVQKYLDADYWRLESRQAAFATRHGWSNEDVDIVPPERRTWKPYVFPRQQVYIMLTIFQHRLHLAVACGRCQCWYNATSRLHCRHGFELAGGIRRHVGSQDFVPARLHRIVNANPPQCCWKSSCGRSGWIERYPGISVPHPYVYWHPAVSWLLL